MKKLLAFLLCMLMAVSVFGALSVSAEEASIPAETIAGLVEFNGYSVRTNDYNGIRAEFDLDKAKLAELEATYDVKIDMLFAKAGAEAPDSFANYDAVQLGNAGAASTFYDSKNGGYLGKIYSEEDGKAKFFYTVTFKNASETKDNLNADLYFRLVVTLTDKSDATVTASIPVDCKSPSFSYAVSLREVAKKLVDLSQFDNSFVRRAISIANGSYKADAEEAVLLDKALSDYSIVIKSTHATYNETLDLSAARALAAAFEKELGVGLPIRYNTPDNEAAYIAIDTTATFDDKYAYEITAEGSVITVKANTVPAAAAGCEALAEAIKAGSYTGEKLEGKIYSYPYDSLYVTEGLLYQADFFDSKSSFGNLVGGTFGHVNYYKFSTATGYTDHYVASNLSIASDSKANSRKYFDDFIIGNPVERAYGPTMQIMAPWYASSASVTDWDRSQTQYVYKGTETAKTFPSKWQDKYLELGFYSTFNLAYVENSFPAQKSADGNSITSGGEYTLQLVASINNSYYYDEAGASKVQKYTPNSNNFMLGMTRIRATDSGSTIINFGSYIDWRNQSGTSDSTATPNVKIESRDVSTVNEYLVSVSGYYYKDQFTAVDAVKNAGGKNTTLSLGVNAADYFVNAKDENEDNVRDGFTALGGYNSAALDYPFITGDSNFNIGYNMNTYLYAVRAYGRVLSEAEVIQNHFADVAKYFKLDLTGFDVDDAKFTADEKKDIFALAAGIVFDSSAGDVAALQTAVTAKIAEYSAN